MRAFEPLFRNPHILTILANFWPREYDFPRFPMEDRLIRTDEDTQVRVQTQRPAATPVGHVVLLHGLEGNGESGYIRSMAWDVLNAGFVAHRFHMRTCGDTAHLCKTLYHAGLTSDLLRFLEGLDGERSGLPVFLIGFSLGGNVALKLAGELGATELIHGVCCISTPIHLAAGVRRIGRLDNRLYERRFVKRMRKRLLATGRYSRKELAAARSLYEIDDKITAPSFGFEGADHYYATQSAQGYLDRIRVPALLIQAKDDTFIPFEIFRHPAIESNPFLRLIATEYGGHLGFLARRGPRFWLDEVAIEFLMSVMAAAPEEMPAAARDNIKVMETIGRYRIIGELGRGAMGVVYHATDPAIGRSVAIKTIRILDIHDAQQRARLRDRLFREARSAGVLSHPNIVTIYDMDEVDGLAYIAMAYVNGPTLEKILASAAPLSGANMLRILRQAASGLDYAHGRGIVHRDIKPANIMTDEDGAVKITDFGIAKITALNNMTETRSVVGTPNYMSPEQVQGLEIDGRSDQFSLAVIAYEILTGERPFQGEHLSTIVYKIVTEDPADAQRINATLTPQIDQVLRRGLSKKPEDRYPNCSNFVGALEMACAESRGWKTLTAGASGALPTASVKRPNLPESTAALSDTNFPPHSSDRRRPSILVPLLLSVMVVLAVAAVIVWQAGLMPQILSFVQNQSFGIRQSEPPAPQAGSGQDQNASAPQMEPKPAPEPAAVPAPSPFPTPGNDSPLADSAQATPQQSAEPAVEKPSPLAPVAKAEPETEPAIDKPVRAPVAREIREVPRNAAPRLQDVWVSTNPPGAKAVLDDDLSLACRTPCMVHAMTGVHHLTISQAGYENEYREIRIGETAQDVPPITLRKPGGTLMLTTSPTGATVRVNGQLIQQVTPAQINLPPGNYSVTVEKGGKMQTQKVEIERGMVYMRIPLNE